MNVRLLFLCISILVAVPVLSREKTDTLIMKNGDRITCEIKALDADVLYIKVQYILSTLSVDWSEVDHLESKQLFLVKTQDGSVYTGALSMPAISGERPVKLEIAEEPAGDLSVERSHVISINETSDNFWARFNGDFGMGLNYTKANQSAQYNVNTDLGYPRERWSAAMAYSSNLTANNNSNTSSRNEITFSGQRLLRWNNWYYSGLADFLQSSEQGIERQGTFGGGVGRYLKNTNHAKIALTGGIAWQQIQYLQDVSDQSEQVTSALVAGKVNLYYFDRTTLTITATLLPALSDPGRVHFNLNTSYYVKLWRKLNWNITFYGNWDNRPPPGFSRSDYGSTSGLSWTFGNR